MLNQRSISNGGNTKTAGSRALTRRQRSTGRGTTSQAEPQTITTARLQKPEQVSQLRIATTFADAITYRKTCPEAKRCLTSASKQFQTYIKTNFPTVNDITELKPFMVQAYHADMQDRGLSENTQRLYLRSVKLAENYVTRNRLADDMPVLVTEAEIPNPPAGPKRFLTLDQLLLCIARARDNYLPSAVLGFALGGLAGLRLTEICRLNPERLMFGDCVSIEGRVKNRHSERIIPLCDDALKALRTHVRYFGKQKHSARGCFYTSVTALSHTMREVLDELAEETGQPEFSMCEPHEGARKTFDNLLYEIGVPIDVREGYQGRKTAGEGAAHYTDIIPTTRDMPAFRDRKLALFRERVIEPLQQRLSS